MQIRLAFHVLGLWLCLFTSSFCYLDGKTIEVAGEPNKVFAEFKTTEVVEFNDEGKFAVPTPKSFFKKPLLHMVPIVKKPFPPKPYFKKSLLRKIPIVKKPLPSPVPDFKLPIPLISHPSRRLIPQVRPGYTQVHPELPPGNLPGYTQVHPELPPDNLPGFPPIRRTPPPVPV